jgi:hypothetical protein
VARDEGRVLDCHDARPLELQLREETSETRSVKRQDARDARKPEEPSEEIDRQVSRLLAAAVEVHRVLGPGFLESVYERALCVELGLRNLPYRRQIPILVDYKGQLGW